MMVKTSNIFIFFFTVAFLAMSPLTVEGAPFSFTWSDTVTNIGGTEPPGVSAGDPFDFTFVVDNGGSSVISQTWGVGDFVSATIDVNGGAYIGTKSFISGSSSGSFQTDGAGNITLVPSSWTDFFTGNPYSDSLGNNESNSGIGGYFINGNNEVWAINTPTNPGGVQIEISALMVSDNQDPASWTVRAVPEPSTLALAALGLLGIGYSRRKRA